MAAVAPSFTYNCGCEWCREGLATTHNDPSHDQRMQQKLLFQGKYELNIQGGTTKCARVFMQYLEGNVDIVRGKRVLEVGSGTGLVGMCAALAGASEVIMTDQEPMLEILQHNIAQQTDHDALQRVIRTCTLQWGEPVNRDDLGGGQVDVILGSDLIFAHENILPLVQSIDDVRSKEHTHVWYASIRRFHWEDQFFVEMEKRFNARQAYTDGDIIIWHYTPK